MAGQHAARKGGRGARQRILDTAAELFYREGINATGVERLASESSVSKRTLYQHFPSKTAVVEEYLRSIGDVAANPLRVSGKAAEQPPRSRLLALFDSPRPGTAPLRGCPFHNAAVEAAGAMPGVESIVRATKQNFIDGLTELAREAGAGDPHSLGSQLAVLYEGAAALATSLNDASTWEQARAAAETLIDRALAS
ncbi:MULTISPECIES: TetR/AcrR family transcriptional regulator [Mycobacterium]|uniref:HTH-type transcriptional repressor KstR2 n=1 Tax=Mycobacterium persicum TaxID=1487726 RepID=A0A1X0LD21_9MYCO|nr:MULTISPECIES: TetR/AcrR family transcriptional regulator [Mycobacterium]KZS81209.1 TetR family transcriptional regulator [Mycobacterium persicum]ORB35866.1 TetR family transcriptional regulator [Mycobacterium persicum]ORB91434.1 TetR family transcriptional regulator [Mycobacterium persicum]ORB96724.1 TetR family transcriptional regulator [Mycobacterium persicum]ORC08889.1 TetR family transcriptional regulator [Mycobacterium persicum]